jgi:hypothetical protein
MAIEVRTSIGIGSYVREKNSVLEPSRKEILVCMGDGFAQHWMQVVGPDTIILRPGDPRHKGERQFDAERINHLRLRAVSMIPLLNIKYVWVEDFTDVSPYEEE